MSHINPEDGIRYADDDEEYHVHGYIKIMIPINFYTTDEDIDEAVRRELDSDIPNNAWFEYDDIDIDIVKRE